MHMLIILHRDEKPRNTDDYDNYVCAEIPDPDADPELYETITSANIHASCGLGIPNISCMKDGRCSKIPQKYFFFVCV